MSTATNWTLSFHNAATEPTTYERDNLNQLYAEWQALLGSRAGHVAAVDLIAELMAHLGATVEADEFEQCDECDEEADNFWPNLKEPVQMCASCTHNARRSGWEPGQ